MKSGVKTALMDCGKTAVLTVCLIAAQAAALKFDNFFLQAAAALALGLFFAFGGLRLAGVKTLSRSMNFLSSSI